MSDAKTVDGAALLGAVTGLGTERARELWAEVQRGYAQLQACVGPHDFVPRGEMRPLGQLYACRLCGGEVGASDRYWYVAGVAHGRKAPTP